MTVLNTETRLLATEVHALPRVNLMPPDIAEKRAFRRVQMGLGAAALASVGVVGLLFMSASSSVSSAQEDLDAASATQVKLQKEVASYASVTADYATAEAAQQQLVTAMGDEVRYSQLLNDLSLSVPSNVWLSNLTFTQTQPNAAAAAKPGAAAPAAADAGIGTLTVNGVGWTHDDVALWLESLSKQKTYVNPYFSLSTEAYIGTRKTVNFSSTVTVTPAAQSGRYSKTGG